MTDKPDAKMVLTDLAYVMDDKVYIGAVWETCRELYRALAASQVRLAERDEAVQRSANAATDMARLLAVAEARVEAAVLLAFQMQQSAAAIQSDPDKANAVSAAWVIDIAGRLLAALAAGEVKPADRVYDEWGQNVMDVPPEEVKHD